CDFARPRRGVLSGSVWLYFLIWRYTSTRDGRFREIHALWWYQDSIPKRHRGRCRSSFSAGTSSSTRSRLTTFLYSSWFLGTLPFRLAINIVSCSTAFSGRWSSEAPSSLWAPLSCSFIGSCLFSVFSWYSPESRWLLAQVRLSIRSAIC